MQNLKEKLARRIKELPPYLFAQLDEKVMEIKSRGVDVISLGVGDPDMPTPESIVNAMKKAIQKPENHQYPSYRGSLPFRKACAKWMKERFNVELDPEGEVIALIGSKEGIAHFPLAFIENGDVALVPEPAYPVYAIGVKFAGGDVYHMSLKEENHFLPILEDIPADVARKSKIMYINYPNNPTSARADLAFFQKVIEFARNFDIIVVHDAAYSEIYENEPPPSILQVEGAKELAVEFHSFSKTFNMTGWRIAFACGSREIISALGKVKTNVDSGAFTAIQEAGIYALENYNSIVSGIRKTYSRRRKVLTSALEKIHLKVFNSDVTFYLWVKTPEKVTSMEFAEKLLEQGVVCTPGVGFGPSGEGYVRFSLTVPEDRLLEAARRIERFSV